MKWLSAALATVALVALAVVVSGEAEGVAISGYFTDDNGSTFEGDIDAIAKADITRGCNPPTNDRYCPNDRVTRGQMAAFLRRALDLAEVGTDYFDDDNGSTFEADINALADAGITRGCNPPANNRYCPNDSVDRGQMAAFLRRAQELPAVGTDYFIDDNTSTFQGDINAIAEDGITRGCNPPANDRYCPNDAVTRGQMAAFIRRALDLPFVIPTIPVGDHGAMSCSKDGERCSLTVDLSAERVYRIQEGFFQADPASSGEQSQFNSQNTSFSLSLGGSNLSLNEIPKQTSDGVTNRYWRRDIRFTAGTQTLVGQWRWNGEVIQTNSITIRAMSP
jgi:hypothetical protein